MHYARVPLIAVFLLGLWVPFISAAPVPVVAKPRLTQWLSNYDAAILRARKEKKIILAYFSGSDWESFTQKLDKDVLNTDMFREWAEKNVVLLQVDFPKEKHLSVNTKAQNDRLKQRFSIVKVPTFILMDSSSLPFARAGFDEAKLREDEAKEEPRSWIKYLDETIKNRPPDEELNKQRSLSACLAYGQKHFLSSVLLINQGRQDRIMQIKDELIQNQQFVRFINRNVAYAEVDWPYESDLSAEAVAFRQFAAEQKIGPSPLQLVIVDMQTRKVKGKIVTIDPAHIDNIMLLIGAALPRLDYNSGWIEDYRQAQAIAQQQNRYIFIAFTSMDSSEYSKKIDEEIFKTDEFKTYAKKHLVLVRIDFPASTTQPANIAAQNKILAEQFAIRGFPSIVVMNPQVQKIGDGKYIKGGPEPFLKEVNAAVKSDETRQAILSGER